MDLLSHSWWLLHPNSPGPLAARDQSSSHCCDTQYLPCYWIQIVFILPSTLSLLLSFFFTRMIGQVFLSQFTVKETEAQKDVPKVTSLVNHRVD